MHDRALGAKHAALLFPVKVIRKRGTPCHKEPIGQLERNGHDVGHVHLGTQIIGTHHRDCLGNLQVQQLVPETDLVNHIFKHVSAGIIKIETPVQVTVGVKRVVPCFTFEQGPVNVLGITIGGDLIANPTPVG